MQPISEIHQVADLQFLISIARKTALAHGLPPALVAAVCEHESGGWEPWAMRFEPAFLKRYVEPLKLKSATEANARATSYGLMQVLGQVARELGFKGKYLTELCDPVVGVEFGCRKLKQCMDKHDNDQRAALLAYNGGGNPDYPNKVLDLVEKYKQ